ncbi:hypothetical protein VTN77DRAFT_4013 [Rasamsonia byssochlamydoides]|uniref:uncharacterized protein n=1 Tax=Rasamsonia byssochlamydoides TaxID=89139 RepID=UPI003743D0E2
MTEQEEQQTKLQPWADTPLPLVKTPMFETGKDDAFTKGASHMALIHNAILRGFNTIYLQAPHVKAADYADFIGYSLTWYNFVRKHHDEEEATLFPKVDELLGKKKGLLDTIYEEHASFLDGLTRFHDYLAPFYAGKQKKETFDGAKLVSIMDSFAEQFRHHFHSEIATIASWADIPLEGSDNKRGQDIGPIFAKWGKSTMMRTGGLTDVVPFLFLNFDRTAEEGLWANWPPMPAPIRWMLVNVGGTWNARWWRFASCGYDGKPRKLYALE